MQLSKTQIETILTNAPQGVDKRKLLDNLVSKGFELEGVDMEQARANVQNAGQTITGDNVGIGFTPKKEFTGQESVVGAGVKTLQNAPRSAFQFGKNIVSALASPIDTIKSVFGATKGLGEKVGREILERTPLKDKVAQVPVSDTENTFNQITNMVTDRYGSVDKFKETVVEDPIGALADISGVLAGTGAGLKTAGMARTAEQVANVAQKVEPISAVVRAVKPVTNVFRNTGNVVQNVFKDLIPKSSDILNKNIVKAFDWTQADVRDFRKRSGQNIGEYITTKQVKGSPLLADSVEATLKNVNELRQSSYQAVRDEVGKVTDLYAKTDVPNISNVLEQTASQIKGIVGLEDELAEITKLSTQDAFSLSDIQRVKEIIDERYSIYKKSGDVNATNVARGLDKVRKQVKTFIEDEVKRATDGKVDIGAFNDDVRLTYTIENAIEKNATRDLTRNEFGLTDNIVGSALGIGVVGGGISLPTAIGAFVAKKILENPTFRLSVAQSIKKLGDSKASQILTELKNNAVTAKNKAIIQDILNTAKQNAIIINPALADLERATNSDSETEIEKR